MNQTKQTLKIYWKALGKYKLLTIIVVISTIAATIAGTIVPLFYKKFFDVLTSGAERATLSSALVGVLVTIVLMKLVRWALWRTAGFVTNRLQPAVISDLADYCFTKLHKHSFSYFSNNFVGSLVKRVNWFTRAFETISDRILTDLIPLVISLTVIVFCAREKKYLPGLWRAGLRHYFYFHKLVAYEL